MSDVAEKISKIDLEPTMEEINSITGIMIDSGEFDHLPELTWNDLSCIVENHIRRSRGLI